MMDDLEFHRLVGREVRAAFTWYLARDDKAALRLLDEIWLGYEEIARRPTSWPAEDERHRYYPLRRYPYRIIYRYEMGRIRVIALVHAKRRTGYWKRRA